MGDINSGYIGINITRNQDTALPSPYNSSGAQETALPCPLDHSGTAGIDMRAGYQDYWWIA